MKITNVSRLKLLGPPLLAVVALAAVLIGSTMFQTSEVNAQPTPTPGYNRIEVGVQNKDQFFHAASVVFTCQSNGQVVQGVFKDHLKDVPVTGQNQEIWGATFPTKCITQGADNGVDFTIIPVNSTDSMLIGVCYVANTGTTTGTGCNVAPNPGVPPGAQNFKATVKIAVGGLVVDLGGDLGDLPLEAAQSSGGSTGLLAGVAVAAGAIALGGAAWYTRRRWLA